MTSFGARGLRRAPHRGAVEPGVRAEAGVVEVPLVAGGRALEALHARPSSGRSRPRRGGRGRAGRRSRSGRCCRRPPSRRRCSSVCWTQATVCVLVEPGARPAMRRVGRVGHVDDHQLAAADVDVLDVAGADLVQVDADQREAAYLAAGVGALAAVHRLVLELQRRQDADQRRARRPGDVVDPHRVEVGLDEQRLGAQEAARDARRARVGRDQRDVAAGDQRDVLVRAEQRALLARSAPRRRGRAPGRRSAGSPSRRERWRGPEAGA